MIKTDVRSFRVGLNSEFLTLLFRQAIKAVSLLISRGKSLREHSPHPGKPIRYTPRLNRCYPGGVFTYRTRKDSCLPNRNEMREQSERG